MPSAYLPFVSKSRSRSGSAHPQLPRCTQFRAGHPSTLSAQVRSARLNTGPSQTMSGHFLSVSRRERTSRRSSPASSGEGQERQRFEVPQRIRLGECTTRGALRVQENPGPGAMAWAPDSISTATQSRGTRPPTRRTRRAASNAIATLSRARCDHRDTIRVRAELSDRYVNCRGSLARSAISRSISKKVHCWPEFAVCRERADAMADDADSVPIVPP